MAVRRMRLRSRLQCHEPGGKSGKLLRRPIEVHVCFCTGRGAFRLKALRLHDLTSEKGTAYIRLDMRSLRFRLRRCFNCKCRSRQCSYRGKDLSSVHFSPRSKFKRPDPFRLLEDASPPLHSYRAILSMSPANCSGVIKNRCAQRNSIRRECLRVLIARACFINGFVVL